jgi:hypothetical protein
MPGLIAAHRGYEYQDLLVASRLVDVLLGSLVCAEVDKKLLDDDRFDDLTVISADGIRERTQFKHTDNDDRPLTLATFTTDARSLRLDLVVASCIADRNGPGRGASEYVYRIVLRDTAPVDPRLTAVLRPLPGSDPGPFLAGFTSTRLKFDPETLGRHRTDNAEDDSFAFLTNDSSLLYEDLEWVCDHLVVEVGAPAASSDLTTPALAERLLLNRMKLEVGAETFPNTDRKAIDVAAALIGGARAARQGRITISIEELLRRAQLRSDFGAVSRAHPVDSNLEIRRPSAVQRVVELIEEISQSGGRLILSGPPGQGKSWVCQQVLEELAEANWLTAEHYCYLGDADGERNQRVMSEHVFGSLLARLTADDPSLLAEHLPRFSADEDAVVQTLASAMSREPNRRIALVIDGIDHVTRVRARWGDRFDPSRSLSEALSSLDLPAGVVLIVLSQPGGHLEPLEQLVARTAVIPGLSRNELSALALRLGAIVRNELDPLAAQTDPEARDHREEFLDALERRSEGNALYATYLCREALRRDDVHVTATQVINDLPQFDGSLRNYYEYLYAALGHEAGWVADVIALVDFSVSRNELRQIRPDAAHRIDRALAILSPVLNERATQGGLRVYHESFARFLRGAFDQDDEALKSVLRRITDWLEQKGLFTDPRSFQSLFPLLAESGYDERILHLFDREFVRRSVAAAFPTSAISANLNVAAGAAARLGDWPVVVRAVELARAALSFENERFNSLLGEFVDVPATLIGAETLSRRLSNEERLTMCGRDGLQMCASLDKLGAIVPWEQYMLAHIREEKHDRTSHGEASDKIVTLAFLRGRLRLSTSSALNDTHEQSAEPDESAEIVEADVEHGSEEQPDLTAPISWKRLAKFVEESDLPITPVLAGIFDTYGAPGIVDFVNALDHPGEACLVIAESFAGQLESQDERMPSRRTWAIAAAAHGLPDGAIHRLIKLGVNIDCVAFDPAESCDASLFELTQSMQQQKIRWDSSSTGQWLDSVTRAASIAPEALVAASALITGQGWYRCWLRFVLKLCSVEALAQEQSQGALSALQLLTCDLNPFTGDPRACDLYSLEPMIRETITRAVHLLEDRDWLAGLEVLKLISDSITTTLSGEVSGPVSPDFLLELASTTVTSSRFEVAEGFVAQQMASRTATRYYTDLARYRLIAARLALKAGRLERARALWLESCDFLTAYGFHKDRTIYEILDSLPVLIDSDRIRGRIRVAAVQGVAERVPFHTDQRDTTHAWEQWWELLAKADPGALVKMAATKLLRNTNNPDWLLTSALEDIWREWGTEADPILSGALRLSLDITVDEREPALLQRLKDLMRESKDAASRLALWILACVDERYVAYSFSNSPELIAKDDQLVERINAVAVQAGLPIVGKVSVSRGTPQQQHAPSARPVLPERSDNDESYSKLPNGLAGLTRALRIWARKPHNAEGEAWTTDRWTNIFGYRFLDLIAAGQENAAETGLYSLSDSVSLAERQIFLVSLAEGFVRYGERRFAAIAYTLAWTKTRSHGGWLSFGGAKELDFLRSAMNLDAAAARMTLSKEVQREMRYGRSAYGVTQALIIAFASGALTIDGESGPDMAFAAWDEALAVISARAPRVAPSDDPEQPYTPVDNTGDSDLDSAFALAVVAGLYHPGRERKRRTLLGITLTIEQRPDVAGPACGVALSTISDPATLSWLLVILASDGDGYQTVRSLCQPQLRELLTRDSLTVRALARRLIEGDAPPLPPSAAPDDALLRNRRRPHLAQTDSRMLRGAIRAAAGSRLSSAEAVLPGITAAVAERMDRVFDDTAVRKRLDSQLDAFADRTRKRWPDAFIAHDEMVESAIQAIAAAGRSAALAHADVLSDPVGFEDYLASLLLNDPMLPILIEKLRQPRPLIPAPPGLHDAIWSEVRASDRNVIADAADVDDEEEDQELVSRTVSVEPAGSIWHIESGPFRGWKWLATMERRLIESSDWQETEELLSRRLRVAEIRSSANTNSLDAPPVAAGDIEMWFADPIDADASAIWRHDRPLVGLDRELEAVGDSRSGLGVPPALLTPTSGLIAALGLRPAEPFVLEDDIGVALALVTWRAEYDRGDRYLARPRLTGCGIAIRPDLYNRIAEGVGANRLVVRDFVFGSVELSATSA